MQQNSPLLTQYQRHVFIWLAIALGTGILLWLLSPVLTPFLLGAILAYILQPGVAWLVRRRVPRGLAALLMMLLFALLITLLVLLILAVVQKEGPQLRQQVPGFFTHLHDWVQPKLAVLGLADSLDFASIRDLVMGQLEGSAKTVALYAWTSVRTSGNVMITVIGNVVMVPLVLFYLLYDWNDMLRRAQNFVPRRWLDKTLQLAHDMDQMLSQYLRGQLLVMAVLAVFYALALWIAGFEIALPVGIFTGIAVFIPYIGYATGLVLALLAALLQFGNWYGFGAVAVIYGIGQVLEGFFLTPRLVGERIGLHPLAVIFALLAFGQLFGFFGVLLALPVSAILSVAVRELRLSYLSSTLYKNN
ncbi:MULTISPECIES: AI-2E family transporter [Paraburkholderia]|uniref:Predicted PurR-regulated permease PerM n=1 Tax=Paraburkholderia megapolitana TaxID=420953 RepID=A0A1I3GBE3_9BURK|nr:MULTISPECIES: AI-2E family transporter [Paraburkholderia]MCX4160332.1 AI-2E family transporter [Paraburkholderia megapolitana]MDN7155831.1 AI-2E family transporter [Paraburkholderia sp. CHISQ3]MDQ6492875.1 AI-2E family transporter [Paraburkholderia megapolitana]QDQ82830.1 AI-2E family transporter [Paraburkholderia megapolitana]SFI20816.1 Predicted PurR-regulated permease PerM [Paraburkholderia megapolitana]